jgi:hypothetical protein
MERYVMMKLRTANKNDFADIDGNKKIGVLFFQQNSKGVIEQKPCYFSENTEMVNFKELYANEQIFVPVNPNEVIITN